MIRRYLALALVGLACIACNKKKEGDATKGSTTGSAVASAEDDPWDPKPKNADAPPPPLASKLGAGAGDELAKLGGPAGEAAPTPAPPPPPGGAAAITAANISTEGLPTHAVKGFAGISQTGFRVAYAKSANQTHDGFRAVLEEHKVFELVAQGLNQTIRMPKTVDIHLVDCGIINAFYDPNNSRIIVCYELLSYFVDIFKGNVANDDQLGQAVIGATLFGFYHELGHALIHQLDLPAMGREEDSADQIATLLLMEAGDDGVAMALSGAYWFNLQSKSGQNETPFWDEHAFDGQRYYNILCLIYGSNPSKYSGFVESGNLPQARAQRCTEEFTKIRSSFVQLPVPARLETFDRGEERFAPRARNDRRDTTTAITVDNQLCDRDRPTTSQYQILPTDESRLREIDLAVQLAGVDSIDRQRNRCLEVLDPTRYPLSGKPRSLLGGHLSRRPQRTENRAASVWRIASETNRHDHAPVGFVQNVSDHVPR